MTIRRASSAEHAALRDLRLRALAGAPDAFVTTYGEAVRRSAEEWRAWADEGAIFVADVRGGLRGMARAVHDDTDPTVVWLLSMWVDPEARGTGAGDALVQAVVVWANDAGARLVRLEVAKANGPARRLYARNGFVETGTERIEETTGTLEIVMERLQ